MPQAIFNFDKLIPSFEKVQKIPYKVCKFEECEIDEKIQFGDCRHKSTLLKKILEKEGLEVKKIKVVFDWRDLPIPEKILSILKKSGTVWVHDSLLVKLNKKWIKVDCTWDPSLEKKGFPVTSGWNGKDDTLQVTKGKLKFIQNDAYKIKLDKTEIKEFAEELNKFLAQKV